jgi:hypothetical protein
MYPPRKRKQNQTKERTKKKKKKKRSKEALQNEPLGSLNNRSGKRVGRYSDSRIQD